MKFHAPVKSVVFLLAIFLFSLSACGATDANANIREMEILQNQIKGSSKFLNQMRQEYYLYEDALKPEIWVLSLNNFKNDDSSFKRELIILDLTMEYYKKVIKGETRFNAEELKSAIRSYETASNAFKETIRKKMVYLKQKIVKLENEIIEMNNVLVNLLEKASAQATNNSFPGQQTTEAIWAGNWRLKSQHTRGKFKGASKVNDLKITFTGNTPQITFAGQKAVVQSISSSQLKFSVTAGGNRINTTLDRKGRGMIGIFSGENISEKAIAGYQNSVGGTYVSIPAP